MRLIDADILLGYVNKYDTGQPIGKALRAMLEKSPTVDAVPIEWIEEQIRESYDASTEYDGCYDYAWALSELVKRWREENGSVN